jgi:Family of unknown function (DUF5329)
MSVAWKYLVALAVLLGSAGALADVPASASAEISHLLSYLSSSGCQFYRNGTGHDSEAARAHLEKKYRYLVKKDMVKTAEDFIRLGATESSVSHEPYKVRCGEQEQPSEAWLNAELLRYRQAESAEAP